MLRVYPNLAFFYCQFQSQPKLKMAWCDPLVADRCYQKVPPSSSRIKERLPNTSNAMDVYYCITASHLPYWEELPQIWYFVHLGKYFESQPWYKWHGVTFIYLDMMSEALPILHGHIYRRLTNSSEAMYVHPCSRVSHLPCQRGYPNLVFCKQFESQPWWKMVQYDP